MRERFTQSDTSIWRRDGAVLIADFFTPSEVSAVLSDLDRVFATCGKGKGLGLPLNRKRQGMIGEFQPEQLKNIIDIPFDCSPALNLLGLHPALIALARAALRTDDVHVYQLFAWAKYTGEADYDQPFHCDYTNHTLTVPADDDRLKTINITIYLTDVSDGHGAIHYVPLPESDTIAADRMIVPDAELQLALKGRERSAASGAGSIFAYGIDVYHRGTNLTVQNGRRYTLTASYKAAGNDMIGYSAWPFSFAKPWSLIFENATPDQLACLGVPRPGAAFWTERTIRRAQDRWQGWDLSAYRLALRGTAEPIAFAGRSRFQSGL
jgi:hypothetical protein